MDGFALRASALAEGIRTFRIEGTQAAGMIAQKLGGATDGCIEVMTGAVLPVDADCVVPYEDTVRSDNRIAIAEEALGRLRPGHALHRRGSDHPAGAEVLRAGLKLSGREIAVAAACGCTNLTVSVLPKIAVVATGDELVDLGTAVAPHQIRRSNDYALRAALIAAGFPAGGTVSFARYAARNRAPALAYHGGVRRRAPQRRGLQGQIRLPARRVRGPVGEKNISRRRPTSGQADVVLD